MHLKCISSRSYCRKNSKNERAQSNDSSNTLPKIGLGQFLNKQQKEFFSVVNLLSHRNNVKVSLKMRKKALLLGMFFSSEAKEGKRGQAFRDKVYQIFE